MYEGAPDYPAFDRWWRIIEKYRVNILYTSPTAIRALIRQGDQWPNGHDLSSLRYWVPWASRSIRRHGSGITA